jgi:hypothetical protein
MTGLPVARRAAWSLRPRLLSELVVVVPAAFPAALWTVALQGRTSFAGLSARWMATFLLALLAVAMWARLSEAYLSEASLPAEAAAAGLVPAAAVAGGVLLALYGSEGAYHRFVNEPLLKGLALPATALLVLAAPVFGAGREAASVLVRGRGLLIAVTLGAVGALQAVHLVHVATDDLIRYWAIADAWLQGTGYPVTEGVPGSGGFYLIDQPLYPLLVLPAIRLLGHRYLALHAPLILANLVVPFVFYGLARATGASRTGALGLALAVVCFPYYQVYALGAADPEPLWAVEAGLLLLLALRVTEGNRRYWEWGALGLAAGAAALTRPEGTLYAGAALVGLAVHTRLRDRGWWVAAAVFALPVGLFALFLWRDFGVLSPTGWLRIAGLRYLGPNLGLVVGRDLPQYAEGAGLPLPGVVGLAAGAGLLGLVLFGMWRLWRWYPALRFVPVALALNLAVILLTPTDFAGDVMSPQTFLRHLSVLFPWTVPALAVCLPRGSRAAPRLAALFGAVVVAELVVLGGVTARDQAQQATLLTRDPYVLATDLWAAQDPLPWLQIVPGEGRARRIDPRMDYVGFRRGLFAAVRPYDQHAVDAGRAHVLASGVFALAGLAGVGAACAYAAVSSRKAPAAASTV